LRRIVHISDVHFGTVDPLVADRVSAAVNELRPHVVVVSGDLTQRARSQEFKLARAFLDSLPKPQIVVPGNHDVPAYNLLARFLTPLAKYKRYISHDLTPTYIDDELAIVGVNTARSLVIKGGRINEEQVEQVRSRICNLDDRVLKVVVTHHPFDLPENSHQTDVVGRAEMAMEAISSCGGDVLLAGHLHVSHIDTTAKRYNLRHGGNALVIQAGTATSTRVRGEPHSFNVVDFDDPRLTVRRYESQSAGDPFTPSAVKIYSKNSEGWQKEADEVIQS
jgi:3',5'-cyclic AMP phosphodiesterase CpdA